MSSLKVGLVKNILFLSFHVLSSNLLRFLHEMMEYLLNKCAHLKNELQKDFLKARSSAERWKMLQIEVSDHIIKV